MLLLLAVAVTAAQAVGSDGATACRGYAVSGAGTSSVDGCYEPHGTFENAPLFVLDAAHELYRFQGTWKLGLHGVNVSYHAIFMSADPPASPGGCGTWGVDAGQMPCPSVHREGLPPTPPPPPPPPPPPVPPAPPAPPMRLVFEDHFDGNTLNTSKWHIMDHELDRGGMWMASNVAVENGTLVLRTRAQNYSSVVGGVNTSFYVSGAAVNTAGRFEQQKGRWEASVKLPLPREAPSYTLHPSLWLNSGTKAAPNKSGCGQEIDVAELYAGPAAPSTVSYGTGSLHAKVKRADGSCEHLTPVHPQPSYFTGDEVWNGLFDVTTGWTVFTLDWTDERITMSINGTLVANYDANATIVRSFTDTQPLILTMTVMDRAVPLPQDVFPQEYHVDWVRAYAWVE